MISPEESALISSGTIGLSSVIGSRYSYIYSYDGRGNVVEKRVPGKDVEYFVYDKGHRLVLSQDGALRASNRWIYYVYDNHNRLIEKSIISSSVTYPRATLQNAYLTGTFNNTYPMLGGATVINVPGTAVGSFTLYALLESSRYKSYLYSSTSFSVPSYLSFAPVANVVGTTDLETVNIHSIKIYEKLAVMDNNLGTVSQRNIERAYYYDYMGRNIQVVEKNHLDGISIRSTRYDFTGNILSIHESHQKSSGATPDIKLTSYTYDTRGRMLTESTTLNSQATGTVSYVYDALGKLTTKTYGNGATETLTYNIQGWQSSKSAVKSGSNLFSTNLLYYNSARSTNSYTGNIVEWQWTQGASSQNSYALSYDKLNRLNNSTRYEGGVAQNAFTEKNITYDRNGNITQLQRYGSSNTTLQDNLTYSYNGSTYNGNQLSSISGSVNATYTYDGNGNMTTDGRKNLQIAYNVLNLQQTLSQGGTAVATYTWLADGTKCGVVDNTTNGYDYLGSLIYIRSGSTRTLESTNFGGGRVVYSGGAYTPYYYITDHLGSTRVITNNSGAVVERNDYYPFGGRHANSTYAQLAVNRQKFNGKELQTTGNTGFLDYGARMYDDVIARWSVVDPESEQYSNISPYAYCTNNPIRYIDPTGEFPIETIWDFGNVLYDVGAAIVNHIKGNHQSAKSNWADLGLDAGAMLIPYVPAGASKVVKGGTAGVKALDKAADVGKTIDKTTDAGKLGKYSDVPNPKNVGAGKATTASQRKNILNENRKQNNGELRSDGDGRKLNQPSKSVKGQKADMNQAEVDHINPKSKGGSNDNSNLQVLSKEENLIKGNR